MNGTSINKKSHLLNQLLNILNENIKNSLLSKLIGKMKLLYFYIILILKFEIVSLIINPKIIFTLFWILYLIVIIKIK